MSQQEDLAWIIAREQRRIAIAGLVPVRPMSLPLGDLPGVEQVELDYPDDVGDAGLAGLSGGEVAG
jgi:hypothetical protein